VSNTQSVVPVPVSDLPHWRVVYRPKAFEPERIDSLRRCLDLVENNAVSLRGWDFPHLGEARRELRFGESWVESWVDFMSHLEFWRMYQSGQFLYLGAVREMRDQEWHGQLMRAATDHLRRVLGVDVTAVVGCFSVTNFVYTVSEHFEFAARLCQAGIYPEGVDLTIQLKKAQGIGLSADFGRAWYNDIATSELGKTWSFESGALVSTVADASLQAIKWFFERLGWPNASLSALRSEQEKLFQGRR